MTNEDLMKLSESELIELINDTKRKIEKIKLENLKKTIIIEEIANNN